MRDVSDMVAKLLSECFAPSVAEGGPCHAAAYDTNLFRRERLYCEEIDLVLRRHEKMMRSAYNYYSSLNHERVMNLEMFLEMMDDTKMIGSEIWDLSERECRIAYFSSQNVIVDELKSHKKLVTMTFIEFMEALAWLADLTPIPTESEMIKLNIETRDAKEPYMIEFEMRVATLEDNVKESILVRRPSATFMQYDLATKAMVPKSRPLDFKLNRFLYLLGGRLGIRWV